MFCVAGLGHPGEKYTNTRHNLGFRVADRLAERCDTHIRRREFQALTAVIEIGRSEVLLLKPQTYMNLCGRSVRAVLGSLEIPAARLIVVYDDADLALGRVRVRRSGSAGGHRGLTSIMEETGVADFARVRLGIGRPAPGMELADWVLTEPTEEERRKTAALVERGADAVVDVIVNGVEHAMQEFNAATQVGGTDEEL
jgi:PTH1 family peptidyl-tRNA hydrolase